MGDVFCVCGLSIWEGTGCWSYCKAYNVHGVYKHLLAFGLDSEGYADTPSIGEGFNRRIGFATLLSLWPVALLFVAVKVRKYEGIGPLAGRVLTIFAIIFLVQNFPYTYDTYDQYNGDQGAAPYQDFIDHVTNRGGLVFWAHPEIEVNRIISKPPLKVRMQTEAYHNDLLYTGNYTGFSAFYEGMEFIIPPGGIWDRVLEQYATGIRDHPVWAIAEGDVEGDHFSPELSQTVFLLESFTREDALLALESGRIYATAGPNGPHVSLDTYELRSANGEQTAYMGQTLQSGTPVTLHVEVSLSGPVAESTLSVNVIKNGRSVREVKGTGSVAIEWTDEDLPPGRLHVYRVDVHAPKQSRVLTNPIFADRRAR